VRILFLVALLFVGCETNAELGLELGPLEDLLAVEARPLGASAVELRVALVGWDGQPLAAADRVRAGQEVRGREVEKAEGVTLHNLAPVHQPAQLFGGGGDFDAQNGVTGFR